MTDLIERAKALALAGDFSPDDLGGDIGTMSLRNPDGPELLSIVQSLSERIAVLEGALGGIERIAEKHTGISGARSLQTAMHAISHAARASLIKEGSHD